MLNSDYLGQVLNPGELVYTADNLVKLIQQSKVEFDSIAFRGMSGALIAPMIAAKMGKELIMVRKEGSSHSMMAVEGYANCKAFIIVDDMVETGGTVQCICEKINRFCPGSKAVGIFLYYKDMCVPKAVNFRGGEIQVFPLYRAFPNGFGKTGFELTLDN
jgi:orotate phosphoribosyltransferase